MPLIYNLLRVILLLAITVSAGTLCIDSMSIQYYEGNNYFIRQYDGTNDENWSCGLFTPYVFSL